MNMTKNSTFFSPMQLFKAPQWWSNPRTHTLHVRQCELFFGLNILHVSQYLALPSHSSDTPSEPPTSKPSTSPLSISFSLVTLRFGITIPGSVTAVNTHVDKHTIATTPCDDVFVKSKTIKPKNAHNEHVEKTHTGAK